MNKKTFFSYKVFFFILQKWQNLKNYNLISTFYCKERFTSFSDIRVQLYPQNPHQKSQGVKDIDDLKKTLNDIF